MRSDSFLYLFFLNPPSIFIPNDRCSQSAEFDQSWLIISWLVLFFDKFVEGISLKRTINIKMVKNSVCFVFGFQSFVPLFIYSTWTDIRVVLDDMIWSVIGRVMIILIFFAFWSWLPERGLQQHNKIDTIYFWFYVFFVFWF